MDEQEVHELYLKLIKVHRLKLREIRTLIQPYKICIATISRKLRGVRKMEEELFNLLVEAEKKISFFRGKESNRGR